MFNGYEQWEKNLAHALAHRIPAQELWGEEEIKRVLNELDRIVNKVDNDLRAKALTGHIAKPPINKGDVSGISVLPKERER